MASFSKEYGRWELGIDQDCPACEGCGEVCISLDTYGPDVRTRTCNVCEGSGFKYRHPADGLRGLKDKRELMVRTQWPNARAAYAARRAEMFMRTPGWFRFVSAERALRSGAEWRAAA